MLLLLLLLLCIIVVIIIIIVIIVVIIIIIVITITNIIIIIIIVIIIIIIIIIIINKHFANFMQNINCTYLYFLNHHIPEPIRMRIPRTIRNICIMWTIVVGSSSLVLNLLAKSSLIYALWKY